MKAIKDVDGQKSSVCKLLRNAEELIHSRRELDRHFEQVLLWLIQAKVQISRVQSMPKDEAKYTLLQIQNEWDGLVSVREEVDRQCQLLLTNCTGNAAECLKKQLRKYEDDIEEFLVSLKTVDSTAASEPVGNLAISSFFLYL